MEKTKLGISENLFSLIIFLVIIGQSPFACFAVLVYIFSFEKNDRLKKNALIAFFLSVILISSSLLITWTVGGFNSISYILERIYYSGVALYDRNEKFNILYNIDLISTVLNHLFLMSKVIVPLIFGFRAYKGYDFKINISQN